LGAPDPHLNGDPHWEVRAAGLLVLAILSWLLVALVAFGVWLIVRSLIR